MITAPHKTTRSPRYRSSCSAPGPPRSPPLFKSANLQHQRLLLEKKKGRSPGLRTCQHPTFPLDTMPTRLCTHRKSSMARVTSAAKVASFRGACDSSSASLSHAWPRAAVAVSRSSGLFCNMDRMKCFDVSLALIHIFPEKWYFEACEGGRAWKARTREAMNLKRLDDDWNLQTSVGDNRVEHLSRRALRKIVDTDNSIVFPMIPRIHRKPSHKPFI